MKPYISKISVAILVLFLSACNVSKDLSAPVDGLPDSFRNAGTPTQDSTSIADLPWQDFFADPTLRSLIDKAITKNYDMQPVSYTHLTLPTKA